MENILFTMTRLPDDHQNPALRGRWVVDRLQDNKPLFGPFPAWKPPRDQPALNPNFETSTEASEYIALARLAYRLFHSKFVEEAQQAVADYNEHCQARVRL